MKFFKTYLLIVSVLILGACSSDDDAQPEITNQFEDIVMNLPEGTWEVFNFNNNGVDETIDFEGFVFSFGEDGSIIAATDLFSETGTWTYDDASSDSGDDMEELELSFPEATTQSFEEITEDWDIINATETRIDLSDESDSGTKVLIFTKQ